MFRKTEEERIQFKMEIINFMLCRIKPAVFVLFVFGNYFYVSLPVSVKNLLQKLFVYTRVVTITLFYLLRKRKLWQKMSRFLGNFVSFSRKFSQNCSLFVTYFSLKTVHMPQNFCKKSKSENFGPNPFSMYCTDTSISSTGIEAAQLTPDWSSTL
jgi:hypothetical protein